MLLEWNELENDNHCSTTVSSVKQILAYMEVFLAVVMLCLLLLVMVGNMVDELRSN